MTEQEKSYIIFFDLDRTIINLNSGSVLVRQAYKRGMLSTGDLLSAIYQLFLYKFNLRNENLIFSTMGSWVKGLSSNSVKNLSKDIINDFLLYAIRPEVYKEIRLHKENNAESALLSSAISAICNPIAEYLGLENIICTEMEVIKGVLTGLPVGKFCFGKEKRDRLLAFCKEKNFDPLKAYYYADSISDAPALDVVGHPVCVSPDKKLKQLAQSKGWRINYW